MTSMRQQPQMPWQLSTLASRRSQVRFNRDVDHFDAFQEADRQWAIADSLLNECRCWRLDLLLLQMQALWYLANVHQVGLYFYIQLEFCSIIWSKATVLLALNNVGGFNKAFESAMVKLQGPTEAALTSLEIESVKIFTAGEGTDEIQEWQNKRHLRK